MMVVRKGPVSLKLLLLLFFTFTWEEGTKMDHKGTCLISRNHEAQKLNCEQGHKGWLLIKEIF